MTTSTILKTKKQKKDSLLNTFNFSDKNKALGLIVLNNNLVNDVLLFDALKILPANFIIVSNNSIESEKNIIFTKYTIIDWWFDFIVCDKCEENIMKFLNDGVVPIIFKNHHITSLLSEFNAKKVEGNSFIFENNALCDIYYAMIRFLENYKFPYDHKSLVKNVLDI